MAWQDNLISNFLTVFILFALFLIIYCKVTGKTITEIIRGMWGGQNE